MKVTVRQIEYRRDQCRVEWSSEFGTAWAYWRGEPPHTGVEYDVEIDLPALASMDVRIADEGDQNPCVRMGANSSVVIVGMLFCDDEGGASLQLGDTAILLDGPLESLTNGSVIRCTASEITLFPVNL